MISEYIFFHCVLHQLSKSAKRALFKIRRPTNFNKLGTTIPASWYCSYFIEINLPISLISIWF